MVEDQEASLLEIADRFSPAVATLVLECSKVTTAADGPRAHRHRIEVQRMRSMSPDGQSIKLADIACNAISIARRDRAFALSASCTPGRPITPWPDATQLSWAHHSIL